MKLLSLFFFRDSLFEAVFLSIADRLLCLLFIQSLT